MKRVIITLAATALLWIAQISAASACVGGWYEPDVPDALK